MSPSVAETFQPPVAASYSQCPDAVAYADGLMRAVEQFMEEMLSAFEVHVPARFKATYIGRDAAAGAARSVARIRAARPALGPVLDSDRARFGSQLPWLQCPGSIGRTTAPCAAARRG